MAQRDPLSIAVLGFIIPVDGCGETGYYHLVSVLPGYFAHQPLYGDFPDREEACSCYHYVPESLSQARKPF